MLRTLLFQYIRLILVFTSVLFTSACQQKSESYSNSIFALGTIVDFTIVHRDPAIIQRASQSIQQDLDYMHFAFHAWQPGPLSRINQLLETTATFTVNPSVLPLIQTSKELSLQSQGLFNPAIGHLVRLWGFQSDFGPEDETPPDSEKLQQLVSSKPSLADIVIDNVQMHSKNPAVRLDMGAIAKGYALDRIIEHLQDQGIQSAIINAGGDLKAIGQHSQGRPWYVGIKHPRQANAVLAGLNVMPGESVFTSGDYERFFVHENRRYHHIIDPRTGYPASQSQSVTVITESATRADAASTALFIAGPKDWPAIAAAMNIKYVLFVDAEGNAEATPEMLKRMQEINPALKLISRSLP